MNKISQIVAREIIDSRGNPTVETSVLLDNGAFGTASVPSGASTGKNEDVELRDGDMNRFGGMGVLKAVGNVNEKIFPHIKGVDVSDQAALDKKLLDLDGTENERKLGANAILSVSVACLKAAANSARMPLFAYVQKIFAPQNVMSIPSPIFNLINGGKHGAGNLDFQEFHLIPSTRFPFKDSLRIGVEMFQLLRQELIHRNAIHSVGDEGGFAPNLFTNSDALELMKLVIRNSPYKESQDVFLGLDVAADAFFVDNKYTIKDSPRPLDKEGMLAFYEKLVKDYNIFSLEDPLEQNDWSGWSKLKELLPPTTMLVGDDLITTNAKSLEKAINSQSCTAVIVKPNQIGSVTETVNLVQLAQKNNIFTIFSHRSGETNDTFIADFAVGLGANFAKFGAPDRGERVAKYNRLLEIESFLSRSN